MTQIPYSLSPSASAAWAAQGFGLSGLGASGSLTGASRFEGPCSVLARVEPGAHLSVGAFCNLSGGTLNNLEAGRYCSVAHGVTIGSHEHPLDWLTTSRTAYYPEVNGWDRLMAGAAAEEIHRRKPAFTASCPITTLGPDVWIGQGAFLKAGVRVGAGAIIGARATVVKDVPPYAIVVGTPARVVRLRFPEAVIARLLALVWWRYSIYDLFDAPFDEIERALDRIEDLIAAGAVEPYEAPTITARDLAREPAEARAPAEAVP